MRKYKDIEHKLFVGLQGSFKDACCVRLLKEGFDSGRKIYSNVNLGFPFTHVESLFELDEIRADPFNPCMLFYSDIGRIFNSRDYRKDVEGVTYVRRNLMANLRKRGVELYGSCHREMEVDIDIRHLMRWFIYPQRKPDLDLPDVDDYMVKLVWFSEPDKGGRVKKSMMTGLSVECGLFDSLEEIVPIKVEKGDSPLVGRAF